MTTVNDTAQKTLATPKVSVLFPIYRTNEQYLKEAIESILSQTFTDFELLIIDDCPNDDREAIVKAYAAKDTRVIYHKNEHNEGISPTRNKLIDLARGEYLAVFDHDDISLPERFAKEVDFLDTHSDVGVVSCWFKCLVSGDIVKNPSDDATIKMVLMRGCPLHHPASMIRKSLLTQYHIRYEEQFSPAEDYALWCRLLPHTNFYNIPEVLFHYRDHEGNTSHLQAQKMEQATEKIRFWVKAENPYWYEQYLTKHHAIRTKINLFGLLTLMTIYKTPTETTYCLFTRWPLLKLKRNSYWTN